MLFTHGAISPAPLGSSRRKLVFSSGIFSLHNSGLSHFPVEHWFLFFNDIETKNHELHVAIGIRLSLLPGPHSDNKEVWVCVVIHVHTCPNCVCVYTHSY